MGKWRKKPVEIEAEHFTDENKDVAFNYPCKPDIFDATYEPVYTEDNDGE